MGKKTAEFLRRPAATRNKERAWQGAEGEKKTVLRLADRTAETPRKKRQTEGGGGSFESGTLTKDEAPEAHCQAFLNESVDLGVVVPMGEVKREPFFFGRRAQRISLK